jgi:protein-disulfide isomerase
MRRLSMTVCIGLMTLLVALALVGSTQAQEDAEARKARILANLKLQFPQLEQATITMNDITPTEFPGLEQGSFTIQGRGAQNFLVSSDDKKLWMVGTQPIDVSLTDEAIQAKIAEAERKKAAEAAERLAKLDEAIAGHPTRGNPDAAVTIVEFSDFQCPYCARGANTVEELLKKYPEEVKFVFKHFPLGFHNWAKPAAIATNCAAEQSDDAFWVLHDKFFEGQRSINESNVITMSKKFLEDTDVDLAKWSTCAEDTESAEYKAVAEAVDADMALGKSLGVTGTPGFFVNGTFLNGAQPVSSFEPLIEKAKAGS